MADTVDDPCLREQILNETDTYIIDDFMTALDTQIRLRGWQPTADTVTADVQVAYYIKLKEHTEYTTQAKREEREFSGGFVYDRDQRGWEYAEREPDINVYTIEIGTLTLLVYDAESSRLVWRGKLQTEINRSLPKEKREARIREVAEKLISRIPQK